MTFDNHRLSHFGGRVGFSSQRTSLEWDAQVDEDTLTLTKLPGLYRVWDLQFVLTIGCDYEVCYAESAGDGTPLFAVYRRPIPAVGDRVAHKGLQ